MKGTKENMKNKRGITLVALVITIIILIILASVSIHLVLEENGIFVKTREGKEEYNKQEATEKINLKITSAQMDKYTKSLRFPTLQELADVFCEDDEIEYVTLTKQEQGSIQKIEVGNNKSIYTKLKEYPYEFEINSSLQLASINGIEIATNTPLDYEKIFESIKHVKDTNTLISSGITPSSEEIKLEAGNYILVALGKTAEYNAIFSITGSDAVKELNIFHTKSWVEGNNQYLNGRGSASVKLYTACLKEPTTLIFSIQPKVEVNELNAVGMLSIYQLEY